MDSNTIAVVPVLELRYLAVKERGIIIYTKQRKSSCDASAINLNTISSTDVIWQHFNIFFQVVFPHDLV
jgi:hypothetical protein